MPRAARTRLEPVPDDNQQDKEASQSAAEDAVVDAARGEVVESDGPRTIEWNGLTLTLPKEMPAWFMFDMTDSEISEEDGQQNSFAIHSVRNLLGAEQWKQARNWSVEKNLPMEQFIELVNQVYSTYGVGPGEAESSSDSSEAGGN